MIIGIDARFYNESGVGRYIRNLISNLQLLDKENQYVVFMLSKDLADFKISANFKAVAADFPWYGMAEQFKFPALLNKYNLDLMHFPHFNVPVFYKGKFVVTIHDLIHRHFNLQHSTTHGPLVYQLKQIGYSKVFNHAIKKSVHILVPSKHVKEQLINETNLQGQKITITNEAADDRLLNQSKTKTEINGKYILFVGNAHPHKNVEGLLKAFQILKKTNASLKLVLVGKSSYFWQRLQEKYRDPDIIYTGFVTDIQLTALYQNAVAYIEPSFEEGFGIPILEAMALGAPVVSSSAGSLPEVGGEAAIYFNPKNIPEMANKISSVIESASLRKELIKKGQTRVKLFSWKHLAQQTLEVYEKCELQ